MDKSSILFLCSGNYYRSRYAELYFNKRANELKLPYKAFSRGLAVPNSNNPGPISYNALMWLKNRNINIDEPVRSPMQVQDNDFESASRTIALKAAEHQPMMQNLFPERASSITYWNIHDIDMALPEETLTNIEYHVDDLIRELN